MDVYSKDIRSAVMRSVKGRNTTPEIIVRSLLHSLGFRFTLHSAELPGKPDVVLPRHRKVVFVHGCFWHSHKGCKRAKRPKSNKDFWKLKLDGNRNRDRKNCQTLRRLGWDVLIVWQCETNDRQSLRQKLESFLGDKRQR